MSKLDAGDVVVIPAVDRLLRDPTDLLVVSSDMRRAGAGPRSLGEPVVDTTSDFAELAMAAKHERRIMERTGRRRADAKSKAVCFGRKPELTPHQARDAQQRLAAGEIRRSTARSYNVSHATISRLAS
jgi:DNA invertase Pin-like site-specific DNA recombinase